MNQQPAVNLSEELSQALAMEEYHREQLIWWKQRREYLEQQIPTSDNPLIDFIRKMDNDQSDATTRA